MPNWWIYVFCRTLAWIGLKLYCRLGWVGAENVLLTGGGLLACNHQSFADPPIVGIPLRSRMVCFMARRSLFRNWFFGWLIRSVNTFPVNRGAVDPEAIKTGIEKMREGQLLLVFPEGTRTRDGEIGKIRPGAAMMAARAGVPIIPVAIHGAFEAWPRQAKLPRPRRISVAYGEPIPPPGASREERQAATDLLIERMHALKAMLARMHEK